MQGNDAQGLVLMPGSMHTVDVLAQTGGDFLLRCRVSEHLQAGMQARLHVEPSGVPSHFVLFHIVDSLHLIAGTLNVGQSPPTEVPLGFGVFFLLMAGHFYRIHAMSSLPSLF